MLLEDMFIAMTASISLQVKGKNNIFTLHNVIWEINFFSSTQKIYILQSRLHYLYSRVQNMDPSVDQVRHIDQVHQTIDQVHKPPFMDQVNGHPIFTTPYKQRCWYAWSLAHISMWLYLQFLSCQSWLTSIKVSTALFSRIPLSCLVGFFLSYRGLTVFSTLRIDEYYRIAIKSDFMKYCKVEN